MDDLGSKIAALMSKNNPVSWRGNIQYLASSDPDAFPRVYWESACDK